MNLEGIMLSKTSQTEKDIYCIISLICGIENVKLIGTEWLLPGLERWGNLEDESRRVKLSVIR